MGATRSERREQKHLSIKRQIKKHGARLAEIYANAIRKRIGKQN